MGTVSLQGRSILGLEDFKAEEIERVLDVAAQMKRIVLSGNKKKDYLKGNLLLPYFPRLPPGRAVLLNLPASIWGRMLLILQRAAAQ